MRKYSMSKKSDYMFFLGNKKVIVGIALAILIVVGVFIYKSTMYTEVHYHAGFRVFVDGREQDFSDFKYMSVKPCTAKDHEENESEDDNIHLHDGNGKVVHVHAGGLKWKDFFNSINYRFDTNKKINGYINGVKVNNILSNSIKPYDSIIIIVGKEMLVSDFNKLAVTKSEIVKAESISESCGK